MESMKQAAKRPRPPFPSPGSASWGRMASRSNPSSPEPFPGQVLHAAVHQVGIQQPAQQELDAEIIHLLGLPGIVPLFRTSQSS